MRGYIYETSAEELADELGVGLHQLQELCLYNYGMAYKSLHTRLRLREAARLLLERQDLDASHIGRMVGIADKSNFCRMFREAFGQTPARWRKAPTSYAPNIKNDYFCSPKLK